MDFIQNYNKTGVDSNKGEIIEHCYIIRHDLFWLSLEQQKIIIKYCDITKKQ